MSDSATSRSSSFYEALPLCPGDDGCPLVNDRAHQRQYAHTCRLYPCFHAHMAYHTRIFRHQPGQAAKASDQGSNTDADQSSNASSSARGNVSRSRAAKQRKNARNALASVSFLHISPDVPNAKKIVVVHAAKAYEISGDWTQVRVHTFKRYLYQVTGVKAAAQVLTNDKSGAKLLDETLLMSEEGIDEGTQITVGVDEGRAAALPPVSSAAAAAQQNAKIPLSWL
jgi:hypothetical protein